MEPQESTRGLDLMRGAVTEQRTSTRCRFHLSGSVRLAHSNGDSAHLAFTRDLSTAGLFFFSDLEPRMSDDVVITLATPQGGSLLLQGRVVRVERHKPGAAVGIAVLLTAHLLAS